MIIEPTKVDNRKRIGTRQVQKVKPTGAVETAVEI